jgi:hypothetical protein
MIRWPEYLVGGLALAAPALAFPKPIAFADGTTVMAEYGAGTMKEIQIFYAPEYNYSVGGGRVELNSDETSKTSSITYARLNYLLHRWNLDAAQANLFVWGGFGGATGNTFSGTVLTKNVGGRRTTRLAVSTAHSRPTGRGVPSFRTGWTPCSSALRPISTSTAVSRLGF